MNKQSNNVIARSVFLNLARHKEQGDTIENAAQVVRRHLAQVGIYDEALVLENGSGLSRRERVTARMLGQLLIKAYAEPFRVPFVDSLPISGGDGTLKNRFKEIGSSLHLKTGTLKNVRALAGYWLPENPQQHPLVIVVLVNSPNAKQYLVDVDNLVKQILTNQSNIFEQSIAAKVL